MALTITSLSRSVVPGVILTSQSRVVTPDWRSLVLLPDEELARYDIAAVNLACAEGLPESERIDPDRCLATLDAWAGDVQQYTKLLTPQFHRRPYEYENSEAYFRMLCLVTVLQRDKGVRYNQAKIPEDVPLDTEDSFIHGIITGNGGTCTSMPVVYAAVGRRLGYPVKLATARGLKTSHLFARWDDPRTGERFNIEATNQGLSTPGDDYFRNDPYHHRYNLDPEVERQGQYLVSQTPRMELAGFMAGRAWRFQDVKDWRRCIEARAWAASVVPQNEHMLNSLKHSMYWWEQEQNTRKPPGFPLVFVKLKKWANRGLPRELEGDIQAMWAIQNALEDTRLEEKYWRKMRAGNCTRIPSEMEATFTRNGNCTIDLVFKNTL